MNRIKTRYQNVIVLLMLLSVFAAGIAGCSDVEPAETPGNTVKETFALQITTEGGMPIAEMEVFVYADSALTDLFAVGMTDKEGKYSFEAQASGTYYAVLQDVAEGYQVEASYLISADTPIVLSANLLTDVDMNSVSVHRGSIMFDFTVKDIDGTEHTLSELLTQKKAVVLNFWYTNCGPCKTEFPYLQEAFEQYSEDIALLALNPVDGTDASIAQFRSDLGLTMPMAKVDNAWEKVFTLSAYPTTVVIDRYGMVSMIHGGMIVDVQEFLDIFAFYAADDYQQQIVKNISDLKTNK